ncbi:MAG TPA: class I SAM-dependent methyltransferase [Chloroflexia bacterium]
MIRQARFYDLRVGLMFLGRLGSLRKLSLDLAALRPGDHVLDVGCGTGALALRAARRVGPTGIVWGIDAAPEMIEVARGKARRRRNTAQFQVAAVERMPFPDASFDVVLNTLVMHQLPGDLRRRALAEIKRVLRPGGRVLLVDFQPAAQLPRPWEPGWLVSHRHGLHTGHNHPGAQMPPAGGPLAEMLREAGYAAVESGPTRYGWIVYARGQVAA